MLSLLFSIGMYVHAGVPQNDVIVDGYANSLSFFPGDSIELYLNARTHVTDYRLRLFNLRQEEVASYQMGVFPQSTRTENPSENGYGYVPTKKVIVPDLKSGVYLWDNKVPIVIKAKQSRIVILYSSNTENAYSNSGGKSLYGFNSSNKVASQRVSFLRPIPLPKHSEVFLRWMDKQGFTDVGYITDMDLDNYSLIAKSELLIIPGHSEYWTIKARKNFDRFVHEGKNAIVLSGNTMWWQVRYNQKRDQLICYRDAAADPVRSGKLKTISWNDPALGYPILTSLGADFSFAGYGRKQDRGWDGLKIISQSPLLENTTLQKNGILYLATDEADGAPLSGFVDGVPVLNNQLLGFEKAEIVGFDLVSRGGSEGCATWIVFKPSKTSGIVINTASTNWCAYEGIGTSADVQTITINMIEKLIGKQNVFSPEGLPLATKDKIL